MMRIRFHMSLFNPTLRNFKETAVSSDATYRDVTFAEPQDLLRRRSVP